MDRGNEFQPRGTSIDENRYEVHFAQCQQEIDARKSVEATMGSGSRFRIVFTDAKSTFIPLLKDN